MSIAQPKQVHVIPAYKNKEWMVYETSIKTENIWDDKRMNNFSIVEITLSMERDWLYFFIEMLIPCFLISCLTILGKFVFMVCSRQSRGFSPGTPVSSRALGMLIGWVGIFP